MLQKAFVNLSVGVDVEFGTSGGLYNQQRFNVKTKTILHSFVIFFLPMIVLLLLIRKKMPNLSLMVSLRPQRLSA